MTLVSPFRWRWCVAALALAALLATPSVQAKTKTAARTTKAAPTPQAIPATTPATPATIINEHIFTALDGRTPSKDLVIDGAGNAYGVTQSGGTSNTGTIFRVGADGTVATLYSFGTAINSSSYSTDGITPIAGLLLAPDGLFYGTTTQGGTNNYGTLFSLNPATGVLTTLASFDYSTTGQYPIAALVTDGSGNFYGVTQYGGDRGEGVLFVYGTATGTLTGLASFSYYDTGRNPQGRLLFGADGNLYGTTSSGNNNGGVFRYNLTTNALTAVFTFGDYNTYGYNSQGGLVTDGNGNFYGTTPNGGANGGGTVFELTEDTTVDPPTFTPSVLYSFGGNDTATVGYYSQGSLLLGTDGNLYGTATYGGANNEGTVFQLVLAPAVVVPVAGPSPNAATTFAAINVLHTFTYTDGYGPNGTLATDAAGDLYGTFPSGATQSGGIFKLTATATAGQYDFADLFQFPAADGSQPFGGMTLGADGNLYGTTQYGGTNGYGTVFVFNPTTRVTTTLYSFFNEMFDGNAPVYDGYAPTGKLVSAANGVFYGTTQYGGVDGDGTIFQLTTATDPATGAITGTVTSLYSFTNSGNDEAVGTNAPRGDGYRPLAGLTLAVDGNYYGTTQYGGANGSGTVYQFDPATGIVTTLAAFNYNGNGGQPNSPLVAAGDGNLYGTTLYGGTNGDGAVYRFDLTTTDLSLVASFNGQNGYQPIGGLTLGADGFLYGTTAEDGPQGSGTLFQVDPAATTGTITTLVTFNGNNGGYPNSPLVQDASGNFYGTTQNGGLNGSGIVFEYNPNTGAFVTLTGFGLGAGFNPVGGLTLTADGHLFGVTGGGDSDDFGRNTVSTSSTVETKAKGQARTQAQTRASTNGAAAVTSNAVGGPLALTDPDGTIFEVAIAPIITSSGAAVGSVNQPFSFQVTATSDPDTFAATALPTGLTINATTGVISGTPTTAGTFPVTVTASNAGGSATQTLTIVIQAAPIASAVPGINSAASANAVIGQAFSYQITANNGPTNYGATGLPLGLSVDTVTGIISGTPTATGTYPVSLSATNSAGTGTATLTLKVTTVADVTPVVTSPASANAQAGLAFAYQVTASNSPSSFGATGLPAGLTINATTGLISGAPTTAGTYTVSLSATNANGTGTANLTLTVTAAALMAPVINSATTASGQVAAAFTYQITASNSPIVFGATGLPTGLSVDVAKGLISGTPREDGTFTVTLTAANSAGTGTATLTLTVAAQPLPVIDITASVPSVTLGTGQTAEFALTRTGGDPTETIVVNYTVGGTAVAGVNYVALKGSKSFKPGKTTVRIIVTPGSTLNGTFPKSLKLTLQPGDGYTLGTAIKAKVKILAPR